MVRLKRPWFAIRGMAVAFCIFSASLTTHAIQDPVDEMKVIAEKYKDAVSSLFLGRGYNFPIALEGARLPGAFHGDPADRLIAATARHHDAELMTVDRAILAYASAGHLKAIDAAQ